MKRLNFAALYLEFQKGEGDDLYVQGNLNKSRIQQNKFQAFGVHLDSQRGQQSGLLQFRLQQRTPLDESNGRAVFYADFWDFLASKGVIVFIINPPRVWNLLSK